MVVYFDYRATTKMEETYRPSFFKTGRLRLNGRICCPVLLYIFTLLIFAVPSTHGGCEFPAQWAGLWFQNGVLQNGIQKPLAVNSTFIDTKGECHENHGDKYVLHDRSDGECYRCIVIHAKHPSVLQYKETYCEPRATLNEICDTISGDAPLFSMFRLDPPPQPCPFKGAPFTFSYSRGSGDCATPPSRAESCTDDSRLLLKYQACPDVQSTEHSVEELVCLATWKEGSMRYLVGKISQLNSRKMSDEDSYRCFIYKSNHHNGKVTYDIAQSGDATCTGILSATEGSKTFKLTSVDDHHNRCKFPSWITEHHTWHSLNHTRVYHFSQRNATLKIKNDDNSGEMRLVCHSILLQPPDNNKIQLVAHVTQGCLSGHICMMFHKRDGGVIEVQHPDEMHDNPEDACQYFDQANTPYTTLITATLHPKPCPHIGRYNVYDSLAEKRKRRQQTHSGSDDNEGTMPAVKECPSGSLFDSLTVGCTSSQDTLEFKSACSSSAYSCHGSWSENGVHYLIASPKSRASMDPRRYCFIYTLSGTGNESYSPEISSRVNRARGLTSSGLLKGSVDRDVMRLSAVASSCSRLIVPGLHGDRAYNLTVNGTCAQSSEYSSGGSTPDMPIGALILFNVYFAFKSLCFR